MLGLLTPQALGPNIPPYTFLTQFQAGHGYTNNAGGSANLNDTADYALGTQSVRATSGGAGTAKTIKKTGFTAVDFTGQIPVVWVKVDDHTKLAALQLYLGDTNLANYYRWEMKTTQANKYLTAGDWCVMSLPWDHATTTGSPNRAAITDAQFRLVDDASGAVTVHYNGIAKMPLPADWPNGVCSITFDDSYASQYDTAFAKMDDFSFPGTLYTICEYIDAGGRLSMANLREMRGLGWQVAGHSYTAATHAARFTGITAAELHSELVSMRQWLRGNGFDPNHLAYPGGEFDKAIEDICNQYVQTSRTIHQLMRESVPPTGRQKLRVLYVTNTTTLASVQTEIDDAYTNQDWIILTFHNLVAAPGATTEWAIADFESLMDYIDTKGIPVRTVGDVMARGAAARPALARHDRFQWRGGHLWRSGR